MIFYGIQIENLPLVKKYVEEGMKLIDETDTDEKGIFMRLKGWYLLHEGRYEEARALLTQAREFFENRDGGSGPVSYTHLKSKKDCLSKWSLFWKFIGFASGLFR